MIRHIEIVRKIEGITETDPCQQETKLPNKEALNK